MKYMTQFVGVLSNWSIESVNVDQSVLLYVCGYVAYKTIQLFSCKACTDFILGTHTTDKYFATLVRSGLTVPSDIVVQLGNFVCAVMQYLISEEYETKFLTWENQKQLLQNLIDQEIYAFVYLRIFVTNSCLWGRPLTDIYKMFVYIMCNILLNNYSKLQNDHLMCKLVPNKYLLYY